MCFTRAESYCERHACTVPILRGAWRVQLKAEKVQQVKPQSVFLARFPKLWHEKEKKNRFEPSHFSSPSYRISLSLTLLQTPEVLIITHQTAALRWAVTAGQRLVLMSATELVKGVACRACWTGGAGLRSSCLFSWFTLVFVFSLRCVKGTETVRADKNLLRHAFCLCCSSLAKSCRLHGILWPCG